MSETEIPATVYALSGDVVFLLIGLGASFVLGAIGWGIKTSAEKTKWVREQRLKFYLEEITYYRRYTTLLEGAIELSREIDELEAKLDESEKQKNEVKFNEVNREYNSKFDLFEEFNAERDQIVEALNRNNGVAELVATDKTSIAFSEFTDLLNKIDFDTAEVEYLQSSKSDFSKAWAKAVVSAQKDLGFRPRWYHHRRFLESSSDE